MLHTFQSGAQRCPLRTQPTTSTVLKQGDSVPLFVPCPASLLLLAPPEQRGFGMLLEAYGSNLASAVNLWASNHRSQESPGAT